MAVSSDDDGRRRAKNEERAGLDLGISGMAESARTHAQSRTHAVALRTHANMPVLPSLRRYTVRHLEGDEKKNTGSILPLRRSDTSLSLPSPAR